MSDNTVMTNTQEAKALREAEGWVNPMLARCYADIERFRDEQRPDPESGLGEALRRALDAIETADCELGEPKPVECRASPFGRHQVDTSMESGPNNCFFCDQPMGDR